MAKTITRKTFKLYGANGTTDNFAQFGSQVAGASLKTKDVTAIQALDAYGNGLQSAVVTTANGKAPLLEDMNGLLYTYGWMIASLNQEGIQEYDGSTLYYIGSIVRKAGTFELYGSIVDDNVGQSLPAKVNSAFWKFLGELGNNPSNFIPGEFREFAMSSPPAGWLECDGSAVSRTTYSTLFAAIGVTWGSGDGTTTFNLPDRRGVFARGWDHGRGQDSGRTFGSYQADQMQGAAYKAKLRSDIGVLSSGGGPNLPSSSGNVNDGAAITAGPITDGVNGVPRVGDETRPKNVSVLICIKY